MNLSNMLVNLKCEINCGTRIVEAWLTVEMGSKFKSLTANINQTELQLIWTLAMRQLDFKFMAIWVWKLSWVRLG